MNEYFDKVKKLYQTKKEELSDVLISECVCGKLLINGDIYDPKIMPISYANFTPKVTPFCCSINCVQRVYGLTGKMVDDLMHEGEVSRSKYEYKKLGLDNFTTGMW